MIAIFALFVSIATATVEIADPPTTGEETLITVSDERGEPVQGATVRVIHRAGLSEAAEMAIGISDAQGQVPWVPIRAGTAELVAGDETVPVRIRWTSIPSGPASALLLLVIAAVLSLGYGLSPRR